MYATLNPCYTRTIWAVSITQNIRMNAETLAVLEFKKFRCEFRKQMIT